MKNFKRLKAFKGFKSLLPVKSSLPDNKATDVEGQSNEDVYAMYRQLRAGQIAAIEIANDTNFYFCVYFQTRELTVRLWLRR